MDATTPPPPIKRRSGRQPGTPKTGGRAKGTPNRLTRDIKAMILGALDRVGGEDYFVRLAETEPRAFAALVGRLLPPEPAPSAPPDGRLTIRWVGYDPTAVDYD